MRCENGRVSMLVRKESFEVICKVEAGDGEERSVIDHPVM